MDTQSHRRLARAEAARTLLELHARDALAEPERWDWDTLDRLPLWCLLDAERRRRLQLIAGAVLLGPELRLWLERERLARVGSLIGDAALARLLEAADGLTALRGADGPAGDGIDGDGEGDAAPVEPTFPVEAIEARLLASGAAVLLGTLHESLPLGGLADSLGEPAGTLPPETAAVLLRHAELLALETGTAPDGASEAASDARADVGPGGGSDARSDPGPSAEPNAGSSDDPGGESGAGSNTAADDATDAAAESVA